MKHSQIKVGEIELHVVEHGEGKPVLLVHGFPDLARGWRRQMEALAAAGYRSIAPDMRGYGRSSAPSASDLYTPFHTVGDLVGLLDALELPTVSIVGHDFGATIAWNAGLLRPDRFTAVFGVSVPFIPPGGPSFLDQIAASGATSFYMFDQMKPEADELWANAAATCPSVLYWLSGSPPTKEHWDPMKGNAHMLRPAPVQVPSWANPEDVAFTVSEFQRTGFHAPLNYYRSIQPFFALTGAFKGLAIRQPSFFLVGEVDGLHVMLRTNEQQLRASLPGLRGFVELPGIGHWPNREATEKFNAALLGFLGGL